MYCLIKLLAFACCVITAAALCNLSKYNQGPRDWLKCSESSIADVQARLQTNPIAISVSHSVIPEIPNHVFIRNATTVENLNFHDCGINRINNEAFRGLTLVKKLSLAYNNLSKLNGSWLYELPALEQLDVSFNKITHVDPEINFQLPKLQTFDLNDNRISCLSTTLMGSLRQLKNIRIQENPLKYLCRAQLTLWFKDHKVNYATNEDSFMWLDGILWQCLADIEYPKEWIAAKDEKMNMCVMSKMFGQLTTLLGTSQSTASSTTECSPFRQSLTYCLQSENIKRNGEMLSNLLALTQNVAKLGAQ